MSVEVVLTLANQGQSLMKLPLLRQSSQSVCSEEHSVKNSMLTGDYTVNMGQGFL